MDLYTNHIGELLEKKLLEKQQFNSNYSLRAFARDLNLSAGTVSSIISGKRRPSEKLVYELANKLSLDRAELSFALEPFKIKKEFNEKKEYHQLSEEDYKKVSSWIAYALLSLIECDDFVPHLPIISKRLGVSEQKITEALYHLNELKIISISEEGEIKRNKKRVMTTNNIPSEALRESHQRHLDLAKEKLVAIPINERNYQSITMPINPDKIPQAKELINDFIDGLSSLLETGVKTEVYKFNCQLFPLTISPPQQSDIIQ